MSPLQYVTLSKNHDSSQLEQVYLRHLRKSMLTYQSSSPTASRVLSSALFMACTKARRSLCTTALEVGLSELATSRDIMPMGGLYLPSRNIPTPEVALDTLWDLLMSLDLPSPAIPLSDVGVTLNTTEPGTLVQSPKAFIEDLGIVCHTLTSEYNPLSRQPKGGSNVTGKRVADSELETEKVRLCLSNLLNSLTDYRAYLKSTL